MDEEPAPRRTLGAIHRENILKEREEALKHRDTSLKYGHPGAPHYSPEQGQWEFTRRMIPGLLFEPVGEIEVLLPSRIQGLHAPQSSHWNSRKTSDFVRTYPDASLAADLLAQDEIVSNDIVNAADHYDPALSNRLAFAYAAVTYPGPTRAIPIVAHVTGESGDQIKFITIQNSELGWSDGAGLTLQVPDIRGDEALWHGGGTPVQQLKSANMAEGSSTWTAVQLATTTTIFRPLHYRQPVPIQMQEGNTIHARRPPSRLHPNPVATIPIIRTGGFAHADVSFNPWYPQQISIIDRQMNWTVWDVPRNAGSHQQVVRVASGNLIADDDDIENVVVDTVDGWACVCWAAVDKLVVCHRRLFSVYHIGGQAVKLNVPGLDFLLESEWILNVKNNPASLSELFVLTSMRIIWLRIVSGEAYDEGSGNATRVENLLSWRHFRAADDVSLCLDVRQEEHSVLLLVYSRLNHLASLYRFSLSHTGSSIPISLSDPSFLRLSVDDFPELHGPHSKTGISTAYFQKIDYSPQSGKLSEDIGAEYQSMGIDFYKMTILASDLSLRERFYTARTVSGSGIGSLHVDEDIRLPSVRRTKKFAGGQRNTIAKSEPKIVMDDFIAYEDEDEDDMFPSRGLSAPRKASVGRRKNGPTDLRNGWAVDYESFYLLGTDADRNENQDQSLDACVEDIRALLVSNEKSFLSLRTAHELLKSTPQVDNVELASRELEELLSTDSHLIPSFQRDRLVAVELKNVWLLPSTQTIGGKEVGSNVSKLSSIYEYLVHYWLNSLPSDISGQPRRARELLLGQVSIELWLAAVSFTPRTPAVGDLPGRSQITDFYLPVRDKKGRSKGKERKQERTDVPLSSSPPATSEPVTPSGSQSSQPTDEDPASSRLRAYTPVKILRSLPKRMANILAHWTEGQDPQLYDWERTDTLLAQPSAEERAAQEKAQLLLRKRKDELIDMPGRLAHVSDEQAPTRRQFGTQQPQTRLPVLATSQVVESMAAASQAEKGKKAKKKKIAGF